MNYKLKIQDARSWLNRYKQTADKFVKNSLKV